MPKVLLAAVLKPVTDIRSYGKIGRSLEAAGYEVHTAGYRAASKPPGTTSIRQHPLYAFRRAHPKRLLAGLRLWRLLRSLRPEVCIVQAIELLPWLMVYRCFFRLRLIYDVQENYRLNLSHQLHYPAWLRGLLKALVSCLEALSVRFVDHYLLAERSYRDELPFPAERITVLENKVIPTLEPPLRSGKPIRYLLLSGTFNRHYGTYEGIRLAERLYDHHPEYRLLVCGMCSDASYRKRLERALDGLPMLAYCQLSETPVPHTDIWQQMQRADMLLLPYQSNPSTARCIPTKVFEALSLHLPMLVPPNKYWEELLRPYPAAVFEDIQRAEIEELHQKIQKTHFYKQVPEPAVYTWEEEKLIEVLHKKIPDATGREIDG